MKPFNDDFNSDVGSQKEEPIHPTQANILQQRKFEQLLTTSKSRFRGLEKYLQKAYVDKNLTIPKFKRK